MPKTPLTRPMRQAVLDSSYDHAPLAVEDALVVANELDRLTQVEQDLADARGQLDRVESMLDAVEMERGSGLVPAGDLSLDQRLARVLSAFRDARQSRQAEPSRFLVVTSSDLGRTIESILASAPQTTAK